MDWYWWLALTFGAAVIMVACAWLVLRSTTRGRRFLGLPGRGKARFARALLADRQTGRVARVLLLGLLGYLLLPFDVIPDVLPVIGMLDDVVVLSLVAVLVLYLVRGEVLDRALEAAEGRERMDDGGGAEGP